MIGFISWWYTLGWITATKKLAALLAGIGRQFSITLILRTLFSPWKQVVADSDPARPVGLKLRGVVDNLISRFVGFFIRLFTLIAAAIVTLVIGSLGLAGLVLWPMVPFLPIFFILLAVGVL